MFCQISNISVLFHTRLNDRNKNKLVDCHFRYIPSCNHDCLSSQTTSGWWRWPRASPHCCFPSSGSTSMFPSCQPPSSTSWTLLSPTWWACSPRRALTAPNWSFLRRYTANLCSVNTYILYVFDKSKCLFSIRKVLRGAKLILFPVKIVIYWTDEKCLFYVG